MGDGNFQRRTNWSSTHTNQRQERKFFAPVSPPTEKVLSTSTLWMHVVYSDCFGLLHTAQIPAETVVA